MGNFTPGPWRACHNGECKCGQIYGGPNDLWVANAIGEYTAGETDALYPSQEAMSANARLIAEAPNLLAVCEMFLAWAETPVDQRGILGLVDDVALLQPTVDKARAAIARAKGE